MTKGWAHVDHQADIGVRGWGRTQAEAFEQVALAMMAVIVAPGVVREERAVDVQCSAADVEMLLADWLNALLCEMSARRMLFSRFTVAIEGVAREGELVLKGRAVGEQMDPNRHQPAVEVKGASYSGLKVEQGPAGVWVAECVVDV